MKKNFHALLILLFAVSFSYAQTTILDFETTATSTTFQHFGSSIDGTIVSPVANPSATGINTSSMVMKHTKPANSEGWAGAFSNPDPTTKVDLAANGKVSVKVWMDHIGTVTLKLENSTNGGANWELTKPNTKMNEWEEITFDASSPSDVGPNTAAGFTYVRVVMFLDINTVFTSDMSFYFDDVVAQPNSVVATTILDFETPSTSTGFQYFASSLDGTLATVVNNPDATGANTSAKVLKFIDPAGGQPWAGAFSTPKPMTPVDLSNGGKICMKVWMDHIGNFALKLEGGTSGQANWVAQVENTKINQWEEICFDASLPSIEAPMTAATGIYETVVLFADFQVAGGAADVISYVDDIVVKPSTGPQIRTVHFAVNMNNYTPDYTKVYVSGTFNNWSGDGNPLADPEFDGIWEGDIQMPTGAYEYKITLDNWAADEKFTGVEECTVKDPSGQFVNRRLSVSGDKDVPVHCFNSCYACGQERLITFRLGMGMVVPSAEGVWLSGGGNFGVPGGNYKMNSVGAGVYELTVPRKVGFSSHYTYANGPCPDYSCKELLEGLPCGDSLNYFDRFLPAVNTNTTVATCFGLCSTNVLCSSGANDIVRDGNLFTILGNPSTLGSSILDFGDLADAKQVVLSNTLGQTLHTLKIAANTEQYTIKTADLASGMYYVTVRTAGTYLTKILVVN